MRITITLLTCLALPACAVEGFNETSRDSWTTVDKREHFAAGLVIGGFTDLMLDEVGFTGPRWQRLAISIGAAALVGFAKEAYDYKHPDQHDASAKDFTATAVGGAVGAFAVDFVIHF